MKSPDSDVSTDTRAALARLVRLYEHLTPDRLAQLEHYYAPDARFKDPFNEVRGVPAIARIFAHMFATLDQPRFAVTQHIVQGDQAFLSWEFRFRMRRWRPQVALAHVSPPDAQGRVTLGLNAGIDFAPLREAAFKVAFVNARMPRWHIATLDDPASGQRIETGCAMRLADFDLVVEIDEPLLEHRMEPTGGDEQAQTDAIARQIVGLLRREGGNDTALPHTVQLGIGKLPNAVANELVKHEIGRAHV